MKNLKEISQKRKRKNILVKFLQILKQKDIKIIQVHQILKMMKKMKSKILKNKNNKKQIVILNQIKIIFRAQLHRQSKIWSIKKKLIVNGSLSQNRKKNKNRCNNKYNNKNQHQNKKTFRKMQIVMKNKKSKQKNRHQTKMKKTRKIKR